jgi:2-oxoacid:acceptor oxidoreductase delta subunit (pyruvate/2-ketoisovalerate family)
VKKQKVESREQRRKGIVERKAMAKACEKNVARGLKRRSLHLGKQKQGFSPVEFGFREKEAIQEAQRCLGVRECESCDLCGLLCPDLCITRNEKTGEILIDLDYCKGCGICASVCPKGAIQMTLEEGV